MSEQPELNGHAPAPEAPAPEEPSAFERVLAVGAILLGVAVIVMGLDMATGGRLLGFVNQDQQ